MYKTLYQYLILHHNLSVPGIGTFFINKSPAKIEFPDKLIHPQSYSLSLVFPAGAPPTSFFTALANLLHITDREAVVQFNDFAFDMKKQIMNGSVIVWNGIGTFKKGYAGEVNFTPAFQELVFEKPVNAEKVIREHPEHLIKVGEEERTATEMSKFLSSDTEKKAYWWTWALIVALLATMFLGWYFSENGISVNSTANTGKAIPKEQSSTYRKLP
jgi:hypothetical protein